MSIRTEHGKPSTVISAAQKAGEARVGTLLAQQKMENEARLQQRQMELEYNAMLRKQDIAIDLQMHERAKLWEIEKMEMASRMDFAREEQSRQRKLDSIDSALQQIDKEVLAGRMTEQEAYPIKLKYEFSKSNIDVPTSLLPGGAEERYGVEPWWRQLKNAPEGSPEKRLYEAKTEQTISGERPGTIPYQLRPDILERVGFEVG
ncbi:MAG: hypothetical protein WAV05_04945, partial [Anaerolineales bacterium]